MVTFTTVRWKNFLSTGNAFTEIQLDQNPSTLIIGENGAGKSTILDALCFVLFNKPFRQISKTQLLNSINQREAEVEVEFTTQNKQVKIIRGIKPNKFEIYVDGVMINQNEKEVITFNAPEPGIYPYICTFPGHSQMMRGIMRVKTIKEE